MEHYIKMHSVIKYAGLFPTVADIYEAITVVMRYHIKSEIIGQWLYCFTNPLIGYQLETAGFWYSYKHCAYIFSETEKEYFVTGESLNDLRNRLGSIKLLEVVNV